MDQWISFLSGNVPGGIFLYLALIMVTFIILFFMFKVNELFTLKHMFRWLIFCIVIFTIAYIAIWIKNPPPHVYKRYTIGLLDSNTSENWFGEYLTQIITQHAKPYVSEHEYLFPYHWLYRTIPADSALNQNFIKHIYKVMPIRKVLTGNVIKENKNFTVKLKLIVFPSEEVLKEAQARFHTYNQVEFIRWVINEFDDFLPLNNGDNLQRLYPPDSLLLLAKRKYFLKEYEECLKLLRGKDSSTNADLNAEIWHHYASIKLAGREKLQAPPRNPYSKQLPKWKLNIQKSRDQLLNYLRAGYDDAMTNILVAESYIWEEDFSTAEIFLEKVYVENPFDIDVLLNLSFLHFSRYKEFGFTGSQDIYQKILSICPIEETVMLKWGDNILRSNPSHTAPPKMARDFVLKFLKMNPYSYNALLLLGKIYSQSVNRDLALKVFLKADSLNPKSGIINYNIGALYYEWGKFEHAKKYLNNAIDYDNYLDAYLYLGVILEEEGKYQEALEKFRYRVSQKQGEDDFFAYQAMKGIQECLEALDEKVQN